MGRIGLAFRIFFDVLFHADVAEEVRELKSKSETAAIPGPEEKSAPAPAALPVSQRSDALTLLESLQREARFLDFIQEDISSYTNDQVGGAVRDVHRGCRALLERQFEIAPVSDLPESSKLTLNGTEPAARVRLVGKVVDHRPVTGVIVHSGWQAQRCDVPTWSGSPDMKLILAPMEVELS